MSAALMVFVNMLLLIPNVIFFVLYGYWWNLAAIIFIVFITIFTLVSIS